MPRWAYRAPFRVLRRLVEETLMRLLVYVYARPEVKGLEHLKEARPPFLFVCNHHSYLDTGLLKSTLPRPLRGRIAPGMTTRYHRVFFGETRGSRWRHLIEGIQASLTAFFFGAWPVPETAGFRRSVAFAGELADSGLSILIFPEGRHVPEGSFEPFRGGIGVLARELRAPVIPAYLEGTQPVLPDHAWWPRFGHVRLVLGPPIAIDPDGDATEITRTLEAAVRALAGSSRGGG
jgi:long-chain acyl-CoA synthetase